MKTTFIPLFHIMRCLLFVMLYFYSVTGMAELPGNEKKSRITKFKTSKNRKGTRRIVTSLPVRSEIFKLYDCPNPPSPTPPNGGEIVVCSANEQVSLISSPTLPNSGPCYFHCGVLWGAPSGWTVVVDPGPFEYTGNPQYGTFGTVTLMALRAPSSISSGNAGMVTLLAEYSQCSAPNNTSSSAILWVGGPGVTNGTINGSPASSPTYVSGGSANLSVQIVGGGSTNWYISHGSGSLSSGGNYCSITLNGFARVVVETTNRCGSGGSWTFYVTNDPGNYGYRIASNPAKDKLSLLLDYKDMLGEVIQGITLYDSNNKAWFSSDASQLKNMVGDKDVIDIATKNFPRGTYFLHVTYGAKGGKDAVLKSQVILE